MGVVSAPSDRDRDLRRRLVRTGYALEAATLSWNVAGVAVLAFAAVASRSVALGGFGLDSLIEIGASVVVIWELSGTGARRQARALRLIGIGFAVLAVYLAIQGTVVLAVGHRARISDLGMAWTAATVLVMAFLAAGKSRTGRALGNPVLVSEGKVTTIDAALAAAVLVGVLLEDLAGWWWADPLAAYILVVYGGKEAWDLLISASAET
jgi:divalent metal cation (Fe/Co/Zn/Cd) transporter